MIRFSGHRLTFLLLFFAIYVTALQAVDSKVTITPEVIQLRASKEIQTFTVSIQSTKAIKAASFTFEIQDEMADADVAFFARNVKWKKKGNTYSFIDIYGKTAKLSIPKEPLELEITVKAQKGITIEGVFKVHARGKVVAQAPLFIKAPFDLGTTLADFFSKFKLYVALLAIFLILAYIGYRYNRIIQKRTKTLSTKANFSTMLKQNEGLVITEFENPFNCRLAGLSKKIKLSYRGSEINAWVGSSFHRFTDSDNIQLKIDRHWEITIETQSFETRLGNQNNLIIFLHPLI
ncbi:MAG: hypothetical protein ABUK01_15795 [Leptospirales bacterium]